MLKDWSHLTAHFTHQICLFLDFQDPEFEKHLWPHDQSSLRRDFSHKTSKTVWNNDVLMTPVVLERLHSHVRSENENTRKSLSATSGLFGCFFLFHLSVTMKGSRERKRRRGETQMYGGLFTVNVAINARIPWLQYILVCWIHIYSKFMTNITIWR